MSRKGPEVENIVRRIAPILLLALAAACGPKAKPTFRTEEVTKGDLVESVSATGEVGAIQTVNVGTQVSGTVLRLYADFNTQVRKGQLLAELDPRLFQAALARADAALAAADADVEKAKVTLADATRTADRTQKLVSQQMAAQADLDAAVAQKDGAAAAVKAAQARVLLSRAERETAATNVALCRITSPIDGLVISRAVDVGSTVAASFQSPTLFTIANDLTRMQILANIDEADIGKVQAGLEAKFTVEAFPGEPFQGRIREVRPAPTTVQNVVTYAAVIDAPNPERRLRQGMTASVTIVTQKRPDVLKLPNAALRFKYEDPDVPAKGGGWAEKRAGAAPKKEKREGTLEAEGAPKVRHGTVYRLVDGRPKPVEVTLGLSDGKSSEVVAGLAEGDAVVVGEAGAKAPGGAPGGPGGGPRRGLF